MSKDISYEIKEHLGILSSGEKGWGKELNIICWNDSNVPKFDIRAWDKNHEHMTRGITLFGDEMNTLINLYTRWKEKSLEVGNEMEVAEEIPF